MKFFKRNTVQGFTLLELIIVVAIVALLAVVVLVSLGDSRKEARNTQILTQMTEYQKAIELAGAANAGSYPSANGNPSQIYRYRKLCIGDGAVGNCLGSITYTQPSPGASEFNQQIGAYLTAQPRFEHLSNGVVYSSPAYSGCIEGATAMLPVNNNDPSICQEDHYSLWFLLQGANQNCGDAIVADATFGGGNDLTLCRLMPGNY